MNLTQKRAMAALLIALAGFAATDADAKSKLKMKPPPPEEDPVAGSTLTPSEHKLDCKRMAGHIKIRLMELRGSGTSPKSSMAAKTMQKTFRPIFGGTRRGADPAADRSRDLARMAEMNTIIKRKNCPYFDLDAELAKAPSAPGPQLIRNKPAGNAGAKQKKR